MSYHVAWCVPLPAKGSGGFRTITQNARALENHGFTCEFYFLPNPNVSFDEDELTESLMEWFGYVPHALHLNATHLEGDYDLAIATQWDTARFASQQGVKGAYFIQDRESMFYSMGAECLAAEESYRLNLYPITIGTWLSTLFTCPDGGPAYSTCFGADLSVYHPLKSHAESEEHAVCAIFQPEKPRRACALLLEALDIVHELDPELIIYLYGSDKSLDVPAYARNLGILSVDELNALYNRCICGVSLSTTNPSRIPFEMMAAGLPVIDLYAENNLYDLPDQAVTLARPNAASLASEIHALVCDEPRRMNAAKAGIEFMSKRDLPVEGEQFAHACLSILNTDGACNRAASSVPPYRHIAHEPQPKALEAAQKNYRGHLEGLKRKSTPIALGAHEALFTLESIPDGYRSFSLACWSEPDQSDLEWKQLDDTGEKAPSCLVRLPALERRPRQYHLHLYGSGDTHDQESFITGVDVILTRAANAPRVSHKISMGNHLSMRLEACEPGTAVPENSSAPISLRSILSALMPEHRR